jgi:hypothetical protein
MSDITSRGGKVRYLSGPVSWYEYLFEDDDGNQKMIHLFGDAHVTDNLCDPSYRCMKSKKDKESECHDLIYFMKELFEEVVENQVYADMFLEIPYNIYKKDIYKLYQDTMIGKIFNQFKDCLKYDKKDCPYLPYVRMNYTDLRIAFHHDFTYNIQEKSISSFVDVMSMKYEEIESAFFQILRGNALGLTSNQIIDIINFIDILFEYVFNRYCDLYRIFISPSFVENLEDFFKPMFQEMEYQRDNLDSSDIEFAKNVVGLMKKMKHPKSDLSIIGYQIYELRKDNIRVNGNNIADLLEDFIIKSCEKIIIDSEKIYSNWKIVKDMIIRGNKSLIVKIIQAIKNFGSDLRFYNVILESYFLDVYILARMFRNFSSSKKKHTPSILSIVYAGDSHVVNQSRFFEEFLGIQPIHKIKAQTGSAPYLSKIPSEKLGVIYKQCIQHEYFSDIFNQIQSKRKISPPQKKDTLDTKVERKWLQKNFNIIYEGMDGMLLEPKEIGGLCEWMPHLDLCTGGDYVDIEKIKCWMDSNGNKYCFDFVNDEYKNEDNEDLDKEQIQMFRKENPVTSKLFEKHEYEMLHPSKNKELSYQKFPNKFPRDLYYYAQNVIHGPWPEAEQIILSNPETSKDYKKYILKIS